MAPPRPYWKGYLKLSLVSCPVAVYSAISSGERVAFKQINGGAIGKVCDALLAKGLAIKVGLPGEQIFVISDEGRQALGLEITPPASAETKPTQGRAGTKQERLVAMLEAPEGASTAEIVAAFGWQPHTVRGAIAGALKKRLGLQVGSEAIEGRGRVYRIRP